MTKRRILITGITGNQGRAAELYFGQSVGWEVEGGARQTGLDLTDWEAVSQYIAHREPYDLVFMTHGVQRRVTVEEFSEDTWTYIIDNNLKAATILSSALLKYDKLNPGGLIVYCSSIQATQPRRGRGLYCIAKGGLENLARIMAVELDLGRRAVALRLGQMEGQMKGIVFNEAEAARIRQKTKLPWVSFNDIARLVLSLYYQPSITGEVIEISSGHKFSVWPE